MTSDSTPRPPDLRARLHEIVFEADTRAGRMFDTVLLAAIVASVAVVVTESVASMRTRYGDVLIALEWVFTAFFTLEYAVRLYSVKKPLAYATSFFGVVDLLAVLPTYISLLVPGAQSLLVIRILRLMRVFRVFKVSAYVDESARLWRALYASRRKIQIFLFGILNIVVVVGAAMHVVEGPEHGFVDIPTGIYWAVVTLTTVGYGDLAPETSLGRGLSVVVMLLGYGIIAVPTGLVTAELMLAARGPVSTQACPACSAEGHDVDAAFCRLCGSLM
jgi:voltage-gated potassium channel